MAAEFEARVFGMLDLIAGGVETTRRVVSDLRTEVRGEFGALRTEISSVRSDVAQLDRKVDRIDARIGRLETRVEVLEDRLR